MNKTKIKIMKKTIFIFLSIFCVSTVFAQQTTDIESITSIISKTLKEHVHNVLEGDALACAALFDDNATVVEGESVTVGRVAIDKAETEQFKAIKFLEMKHTIVGLIYQGEYAYQLGLVQGKMRLKADDSEIKISNKYMASWKKQIDGNWRIHYFIYYP